MTPTLAQLLLRHRVTQAARRRKPRPVPSAAPPTAVVQAYTRVMIDLTAAMQAATLKVLEHEGLIERQDAGGAPAPPTE